MGEATLRLIELGIISGKTAKNMQELAKEAHTTEEVWEILGDVFGRFTGAMELQSRTFNGLNATWRDFKREVKGLLTEGLFNELKRLMEDILERFDRLPDAGERAAGAITQRFKAARDALQNSSTETNQGAIERYDELVAEQAARIEGLRDEAQIIANTVELIKIERREKGGRDILEERMINDMLEERTAILATAKQIEFEIAAGRLLRFTREQEGDRQRQEAQSELNRAKREEQAILTRNTALYDEALTAERLTTSQLERKAEQFERETASRADRLRFLEEELERIQEIRVENARTADSFRDKEKAAKFLQVSTMQLRISELEALLEIKKLREEENKEMAKSAKAAVELQSATVEMNVRAIRNEKQLLAAQEDTAINRERMVALVKEEQRLLDTLVVIWDQYKNKVTDPLVMQAIEARIQGYKFESNIAGQQVERPSLLEESIANFNQLDNPAEHFQDAYGAAAAALLDYQAQVGTVSDQIYDSITDIADAMSGGIQESIKGLITGTMDWSDALENVGVTIVESIVDSFARMLAEWITTQLIMKNLMKLFNIEAVSTSAMSAGTLAAAWAPAAIAASIATLGQAAVVGTGAFATGQVTGTALSTTLATGSGVTNLAGFEGGGYTGPGSKFIPRGIVHAEEFVMPSDVTRDVGPSFFYDMVDNIRTGQGATQSIPNIAIFDNRDEANRWAESQDGETWFKDMLEANKGELI